MEARVKSIREHLYTRRCVACGYDGALIQNETLTCCVACGTNLLERPARSYAEMEGFHGQAITIDSPLNDPTRMQRLLRRWVLFMFGALAGLSAIALLATALVGH